MSSSTPSSPKPESKKNRRNIFSAGKKTKLLFKINQRTSGTSVLNKLLRHRTQPEAGFEVVEIDTCIESPEIHNREDSVEPSKRTSSKRSSSKRSSSKRDKHEPTTGEGPKRSSNRTKSFVRGSDWVSEFRLLKNEDDGVLSREEAKSFSYRYSLKRAEGSSMKDVLGRNSISSNQLLRCARKGDTVMVAALVESGIDVDAVGTGGKEEGMTPLVLASMFNQTETVIALYGLGADLDLSDHFGNTPLIVAVKESNVEVVYTLLSSGADFTIRNDDGESAIVIAANRIASADDNADFQIRCDVLRVLVERSVPDSKTYRLPYYMVEDEKRVSGKSQELLHEWLRARAKMKDLHKPKLADFKEKNLVDFFIEAHSKHDRVGWVKVMLLLCFIIYDTYSPHLDSTTLTWSLYAFLYYCAFFL